jgi:signal transduction histidine kinase
MILLNVNKRTGTIIRLAGLALIVWTIIDGNPRPALHGRGLVVLVLLVAAAAAVLWWTAHPTTERGITPDLYLIGIAGAILVAASPSSASSAFVFVALISAAVRVEIARALPLLALSSLALAVSVLVYEFAALGLLAYALGFAAALFAASNARQSIARAEQAELLLAQTQRSQEEQLRAARLEESTRIAREIHDVLAHALAGLAIQLEATRALVEHGADRDVVLERMRRAHALAREGLQETRRAVGALRGDAVAAPDALEALIDDYEGSASLAVDGALEKLSGPEALAVLRCVQEAMTNVRKHAPGASVSVSVSSGADGVVAVVHDHVGANGSVPSPDLGDSGGGYGLQGMRERAESLGGTLAAGPVEDGWRVELRLPAGVAV